MPRYQYLLSFATARAKTFIGSIPVCQRSTYQIEQPASAKDGLGVGTVFLIPLLVSAILIFRYFKKQGTRAGNSQCAMPAVTAEGEDEGMRIVCLWKTHQNAATRPNM
jgi:hypothetical protein